MITLGNISRFTSNSPYALIWGKDSKMSIIKKFTCIQRKLTCPLFIVEKKKSNKHRTYLKLKFGFFEVKLSQCFHDIMCLLSLMIQI